MDFILIDLYRSTIHSKTDGDLDFDVIVLYEQSSHISSKVYFKHTEKSEEKLQNFFNQYAYTVVTPYIKYKMKSDGSISLQLSI